jgi:AraC-like DNA-binding protein
LSDSSLPRHYAEILLRVAEARGIDCAALFGDQPATRLQGRGARWSAYELGVVSKTLKTVSGDEMWGMGQARVPRGSLQFACELFTLSSDLGDALGRAFRFFLYSTDGVRFELEDDGENATIVMELPGPETEVSGVLYEWWLWFWHFTAQWMIGMEAPVVRVEFPHKPIGTREDYDTTFGPNWRFEAQAAQISFPASALRRRIVRSLADVDGMFRKTAVTLRRPPELPLSFRTRVTAALLDHLKAHRVMPTIEALAEEQGVCSQTLRRRLRAEGASYRALKAEVRRELAQRYIREDGATVTEVAARTGFAEANALTRAVRSWTGLSMAEFRSAAKTAD